MAIWRLAEGSATERTDRLSGAAVANGLVWRAGQVADDARLDAEGQMADILRQSDALLAGRAAARADANPARMTIRGALVDPRWRGGITGVAALP
jgi:enamine deaminase RidA (YjgF/YER057c/UK114 family)